MRTGLRKAMYKGAKDAAVRLYEGDAWRDSIHPGGITLTERLALLVNAGQGCRVLDVAAGKGETAFFLARDHGCRATGIDLSIKMLSRAAQRTGESSSDNQPAFLAADAERLPFSDRSFDVILCECSFSLLAGKETAVKEFYRVLQEGGRVGISDFYLKGRAPLGGISSSSTGFPFLCLDVPETEAGYCALLETGGFKAISFKDETDALKEFLLDLIFTFGSVNAFLERLPQTCNGTKCTADTYAELKNAVREGMVGYCLLSATK